MDGWRQSGQVLYAGIHDKWVTESAWAYAHYQGYDHSPIRVVWWAEPHHVLRSIQKILQYEDAWRTVGLWTLYDSDQGHRGAWEAQTEYTKRIIDGFDLSIPCKFIYSIYYKFLYEQTWLLYTQNDQHIGHYWGNFEEFKGYCSRCGADFFIQEKVWLEEEE